MSAARAEPAPAKVNLTLHVVRRRPDGYHDIESLVVFAGVGDTVSFIPNRRLELTVRGPKARVCGPITDNLILKAARALAERTDGLKLGRFTLSKRLPVAAGLGGGSADAAAALRLLARVNRLHLDDRRLVDAARATGADVPVCLDPRPRLMRGIGDVLSDPIELTSMPAVLANPGVAVSTKEAFASLRLAPPMLAAPAEGPIDGSAPLQQIATGRNDLEAAAIALAPDIAHALAALRALPGCRLARMSGSGATCFGLFNSMCAATAGARALRPKHPTWWVRATLLGDALADSRS